MGWLLFITLVINSINMYFLIKRKINGEPAPLAVMLEKYRTTDRYKILTRYLEVRSEHVLKHGWKSWNKLARGEFKETTVLIKKYTKMHHISSKDFKNVMKLIDEYGTILDKVASKNNNSSANLSIELELLRKLSNKV